MASTFDCIISHHGLSVPLYEHRDYWVYLIHFDEKYKHAQHYLGSCQDITQRLERHRAGNGARLMHVITDAGISWQLARLWKCETLQEAHELERRLKRWCGSSQFCPICQGKPPDEHVFKRLHGFYNLAHPAGRRRPMLDTSPILDMSVNSYLTT